MKQRGFSVKTGMRLPGVQFVRIWIINEAFLQPQSARFTNDDTLVAYHYHLTAEKDPNDLLFIVDEVFHVLRYWLRYQTMEPHVVTNEFNASDDKMYCITVQKNSINGRRKTT